MKKLLLLKSILLCFIITYAQNKQLDDFKSFKQQLMHPDEYGNPQIFKKRNSLMEIKDYGNTPDLNWVEHFGGSGADYGNDIITDADGNVYVVGSFSGTMSLNTDEFTSSGARDGFVVKFDANGNLSWLTQLPAAENKSVIARGINLDSNGNIWATGDYTGSISLNETILPDEGDFNLLLVKLDTDGIILSVASISGPKRGLKIDIDDNQNIYILGSYVEQTGWRHPSFLLRYNTTTETFDMHREFPYSIFYISLNDMVIHGSSIYFAGVWEGEGELDGIYFDPMGYGDAFVGKSDLDGNFTWAAFGDHEYEWNGDSYGEFLAVDDNENIYLAGHFRYNVIFDEDTLTSGYRNGFVTKCSSSGELLWARALESELTEDICVDLSGNSLVFHSNYVTKYDTDGTEAWTEELDNNPSCVSYTSDDKIVVAGNSNGLLFVSQLNNATSEEWDNQFEGNIGSAHVIGMVSDNSGNIYVYANTTNDIDFQGTNASNGTFICKINGAGELVWLENFIDFNYGYGSQGNYINIDDQNGNIYITGEFYDFLLIPGETTLVADDEGSVFILKYDMNGNFIWAVQEDFNGYESTVEPDNQGNVIFSGIFSGIITIGDTNLEATDGSQDGYVAKYDEDGNFLWALSAGGENIEYMAITSADASGNIYLSGEFLSENVTVDETQITLVEGDGNIIFAKIDPDGNVLWVTSHAGSPIGNDWDCWPTGIITDADGNTYMKGWHGDTVYFNDILLTAPYDYSKFIAKIDANGDAIWAKSITEHTWGFDYNQFDIDHEGNVYFGLYVRDTIHFEDEFTYINAGGYSDLMVAKYTTDGDLVWVKTMPGNETSYNWISSVAVYGTENVFVGGLFRDYLSIDDEIITSANQHGFIAMFGDDIDGVYEVFNRNKKNFEVYPNPSDGKIMLNKTGEIEIVNLIGQTVYKTKLNDLNTQIDLSHLAKGIYFIRFTENENVKSEKLILK